MPRFLIPLSQEFGEVWESLGEFVGVRGSPGELGSTLGATVPMFVIHTLFKKDISKMKE